MKKHIGLVETERAKDRKAYLLDCWFGKITNYPTKFMVETTVEAKDEWLHSYYYYNDEIPNYDEFKNIVDKVDVMEDNIDKTQHQFTVNQLIRLKEKKCSTENSIIYTKILTDFERIGDHGLNIAESLYHIRKIMKQMKMIKPEIEEA